MALLIWNKILPLGASSREVTDPLQPQVFLFHWIIVVWLRRDPNERDQDGDVPGSVSYGCWVLAHDLPETWDGELSESKSRVEISEQQR